MQSRNKLEIRMLLHEMISTHYARSVIFMYTPCAKLVLYMCLDPVTSALRQLSPPGAESKKHTGQNQDSNIYLLLAKGASSYRLCLEYFSQLFSILD